MAKSRLSDVLSHWHHLFEGFQYSTQDFYAQIEAALASRGIPDTSCCRIEIREGGILSAKRSYLRVSRKDLTFDICGAPFGKGFFVSWWLSELPSGCLALLLAIPVVSLFAWILARPLTYYKLDTARMFQESVRLAVMDVLDQMTTTKGVRALSEEDRKPIMRGYFAQ